VVVPGSEFKPALRLAAYPPACKTYGLEAASESATGCGYEIVSTFNGFGIPSPHLDMPGLGQGCKGYDRWILLPVLIKI